MSAGGFIEVGRMLPLIILPTCLFSIRVDEQYISHIFCRRFVLRQRPLSQLESMRVGMGAFAVVFGFSDGSHIHFFGAHLRYINAMQWYVSSAARSRDRELLAPDTPVYGAVVSIPR